VADRADATDVFEAERARLTGLAYRLLGSLADAEDVVQDAWFRWIAADRATIVNAPAWLTTVVSRVGLDRLRQRKRERVDYVGPWLPDPVVRPMSPLPDPATVAELSDSLTTTFLLALERLSPEQRLVVLLSDVFGEPLSGVAEMLGVSPAACRQLAVRARRKLRDPSDDHADGPGSSDNVAVAAALAAAVLGGDLEAVTRLVAPDVVLLTDGGSQRHAARRPVVGVDRVGRFLLNIAGRIGDRHTLEPVMMNGLPAVLLRLDGQPDIVQAVEVVDGRVARVLIVSNPDKLAFVDRLPPIR
jgi:RNA polymerase sigma-70 factor (ECF subfamily)